MHLLSLPTWIIHIASVTEWTLAIVLLWKLGGRLNRPDVQRVALAMLPHWCGALCVVTWHYHDDDPAMTRVHFLHEFFTFAGSVALVTATAWLREVRKHVPRLAKTLLWVAPLVLIAVPLAYGLKAGKGIQAGMIQVGGMTYVAFVVLLALNRKWGDVEAFSRLTVFGFGFLLVFVAVTIVAAVVAVKVYGAEQLTHVDWLHGTAESFMTLTNGMIVLGIRQRLAAVTDRPSRSFVTA